MSTTSLAVEPAGHLPFAFDLWYPIARGALRCRHAVETSGESAVERAHEVWRSLAPGESMLLVDRGPGGFARRLGDPHAIDRAAGGLEEIARIERYHVLPGTGGSWVLLPGDDARAFSAGLSLLPAGRARWRLARRVLAAAGGGARRLVRGFGEVALIVREGGHAGGDLAATAFTAAGAGRSVAVASGVPGRRRKLVVQVCGTDGGTEAYVKLATGSRSARRVRHEAETLERIGALPTPTRLAPRLLGHGEHRGVRYLVQEPLAGSRAPDLLGAPHVEFLAALHAATAEARTLPDVPGWDPALRALRALTDTARDDAERAFCAGFVRLTGAITESAAGRALPCSVAHGDFTPWNLVLDERGTLRAFDWELARSGAPALQDLVHHHVQTGILVRKRAPRVLVRELETLLGATARPLLAAAGVDATDALLLAAIGLVLVAVPDERERRIAPPPFAQGGWLLGARGELARLLAGRIGASRERAA